jgi:hypothetical protein
MRIDHRDGRGDGDGRLHRIAALGQHGTTGFGGGEVGATTIPALNMIPRPIDPNALQATLQPHAISARLGATAQPTTRCPDPIAPSRPYSEGQFGGRLDAEMRAPSRRAAKPSICRRHEGSPNATRRYHVQRSQSPRERSRSVQCALQKSYGKPTGPLRIEPKREMAKFRTIVS